MSWVLDLSISLSICRVYMYICSADHVELPVLLYRYQVSTPMVGLSHVVQNKKLWNLLVCRVIGEVLVLGLLDQVVVVYEIPYRSCM